MRGVWLLRLQRALALAGVVCLGWYAGVRVEMARFQARESAALDQSVDSSVPTPADVRPLTPLAPVAPNRAPAIIGRLQIDRLRLSAIIAEGTDDSTLRVAAGHVSGTSLPWETGNTAIAGHRDTLFRPLERVAIGDDIRVITRRGAFRYVVRELLILNPDEVWVLAPTPVPRLTLVTCYPFAVIGPAPQRLVVRADRYDPFASNLGALPLSMVAPVRTTR